MVLICLTRTRFKSLLNHLNHLTVPVAMSVAIGMIRAGRSSMVVRVARQYCTISFSSTGPRDRDMITFFDNPTMEVVTRDRDQNFDRFIHFDTIGNFFDM
jgi:hypothetical protein